MRKNPSIDFELTVNNKTATYSSIKAAKARHDKQSYPRRNTTLLLMSGVDDGMGCYVDFIGSKIQVRFPGHDGGTIQAATVTAAADYAWGYLRNAGGHPRLFADPRRSNPSSYAGDPYWTRARFKGTCCKCQGVVRKGDAIYYYPKGKKVYCDGASCGKAANQDFISMRDDEDMYNRRNPSGKKAAIHEYVQMIKKIGMGFHPDTPKQDYSPRLPADIYAKYDRVLEAAWRVCDPYEVAVNVLMPADMKRKTGWNDRRKNPSSKRLVASWGHDKGNAWVRLYANGDGSYSHRSGSGERPMGGGAIYASSDAAAIKEMEKALHYLTPDAYKTPLRRVNPKRSNPGHGHLPNYAEPAGVRLKYVGGWGDDEYVVWFNGRPIGRGFISPRGGGKENWGLHGGPSGIADGHWDAERKLKLAAMKAMKSRRSNPSLGMPGMPHTWVTASGIHVHGGDTVEFWDIAGHPRGHNPAKVRAKVNKMLVFDDHVQVSRGWAGTRVDDRNFIRVVRRA